MTCYHFHPPARRADSQRFGTRVSRGVLSALLFVFVVLGALTIGLPRALADDEPGGAPSVEITALAPEILTDEDEIALTARLSGTDPTSAVQLQVFMRADPFGTFDEVEQFLNGEGGYGWVTAEYTLDESQRLRASRPEGIEVEIPLAFDALPLWNQDAWGPYGIEVRALNAGGPPGNPPPEDHSVLLWYPEGSRGTTALNMLLPSSTEPGAVATLLEKVRSGVTLALTPPQARALLTDPRGVGTEAVVLPEQGADLSMLASLGQERLFEMASKSRSSSQEESSKDLGESDDSPESSPQSGASTDGGAEDAEDAKDPRAPSSLVEDVVVASDGWLSLDVLRSAGTDAVLTPSKGLEPIDATGVTPSSKTVVSTETGLVSEVEGPNTVTVLNSWHPLAKLMSLSSDGVSPLDVRQQIRALTALVTTEDSAQMRHLWVNIPKTVNADSIDDRLAAALDAPWIRAVTLEQILNSASSQTQRSAVGDATFGDLPTISALMRELGDTLALAQAVTDASPNGPEVLDEATDTFLYPTAAGITLDQRSNRVAEVVPELTAEFDIIEVTPTRTVNVMNSNADFPVTLANIGSFPVTVEVGLETEDPRLQPKRWVEVTVPTSGTVVAQIPVAAVGSGDVSALVVAKTPTGTILDASQNVDVRVRAGLEDTLTWVVAGVLGILFILGLVRTLRKGRRPADQPRIKNR